MKTWTVADAKSDFARGLLASARIERGVMVSSWAIWIKGKLAEDGEGLLVGAHDKDVRDFKTLDAAVRVLESIGFQVGELLVRPHSS